LQSIVNDPRPRVTEPGTVSAFSAALAVVVEIVATILKMRAPGMSLNRIPVFVWAMLVTALMVIFAMPAVVTGSTFLLLDRLVGTHFYNPAEGGDALLWQHLFWFFGHPEVYIIFVPALDMVSAIIATFTSRPVFGYTAMVLSLVATDSSALFCGSTICSRPGCHSSVSRISPPPA
jgi:cytochrome c oxidase subunit 1